MAPHGVSTIKPDEITGCGNDFWPEATALR